MRITGAILLIAICCAVSFAQQTEDLPVPKKRLSVLDIAQMQTQSSEILKQQAQSQSVDVEKLRLQGIEIVPATRLVIKDGAVYMLVTNDLLIPMSGGGASGCLPENPKKAGQAIPLTSQPDNQTPAKAPIKKN
nr:hypothetical protein [uncultured bacterium]